MKKIYSLLFCLLCFSIAHAQNFSGPESVEYDGAHGRWLVSNKNAGTVVSLIPGTGSVSPFCSGMTQGPYGIEINGNRLYTVAGGHVRGYNLLTGVMEYDNDLAANFLNGICTDGGNYAFVSDFNAKIIYRVNLVDSSMNLMRTTTNSPNGMYYDGPGNRIVFVNWGINALIQAMSLTDSTITTLMTTSLTNLDGITRDLNGNWYVSEWGSNKLYKIDANFANAPVAVMSGLTYPADLDISSDGDSIGIPNSGANNNVVFYTVCTTPNVVSNWGYTGSAGVIQFHDSTSGSTPSAWHWDFGDGGTSTQQNPSHTFTSNGTFHVCLTATGTCNADTFCQDITIMGVGVSAQVNAQPTMSPNPAKDWLEIRNPSAQALQFSIFDLNGKELLTAPCVPGAHTALSLSELNKGVYLCRFSDSEGRPVSVNRLLVQ